MNRKEKVANAIKFFLLVFVMLSGFCFLYTIAWCLIGLPLTRWTALLCIGLACLSVIGYVKWCMEG